VGMAGGSLADREDAHQRPGLDEHRAGGLRCSAAQASRRQVEGTTNS
jgi:hypothetical protein